MKTIAIFADVQNIYYTTRDVYGRAFNYRAFWREVSALGEIVFATAYAIDRGDDRQIKFQDALKHLGFNVRLKPYIQRQDGSAKGDWDVGISIDMLTQAEQVDCVILLSGDGDFDLLLKAVRERFATQSIVYAVEKLTARSLIDAADAFQPIQQSLLI